MVQELKKYTVKLAGIKETKWFGENVYQVGGLGRMSIRWMDIQFFILVA